MAPAVNYAEALVGEPAIRVGLDRGAELGRRGIEIAGPELRLCLEHVPHRGQDIGRGEHRRRGSDFAALLVRDGADGGGGEPPDGSIESYAVGGVGQIARRWPLSAANRSIVMRGPGCPGMTLPTRR